MLNVSQQLTTADFLFWFLHELGLGTSMHHGTDSGAISLHTLSHTSTPHYGSSPPLICTPPASSVYPPICSPMRVVSPSVSVTHRPLLHGKIHQANPHPHAALILSLLVCISRQHLSVNLPLSLADLHSCWHRLLHTHISRPPQLYHHRLRWPPTLEVQQPL